MTRHCILVLTFLMPALLAVSLPAPDTAEAAFIRRSKLKKRATFGYRVVVVVGQDDANEDPPDTVVVTIEGEPGLPTPEPETLTLTAVSVDPKTGDSIFAGNTDYSDDAVNLVYVLSGKVFQGGNLLFEQSVEATVEPPSFPDVDLEVLNVPNGAGEVTVISGDAVQVRFSISCEEPEDPLECDAQLDKSRRADRIQLRTDDGEVLSAKRRGRSLSGTVNLRARRGDVGLRPHVGFVASDDGFLHAQSDVPIVIVDNPATAELMERVALTELAIAGLDARVSANEDFIEDMYPRLEAVEGDVVEVSAQTGGFAGTIETLDARISTNETTIAINTNRVAQIEVDADDSGAVLGARFGGTGTVFSIDPEDKWSLTDVMVVSISLSGSALIVTLDLDAPLAAQLEDGARTTLLLREMDFGTDFPLPEKVVLEKEGDFFGAVVPIDLPPTVLDIVPSVYRADFGLETSDGEQLGPYVAFVEADVDLQSVPHITALTATFDPETQLGAVFVTIEGGEVGDNLEMTLTPLSGGAETELPTYTLEPILGSEGRRIHVARSISYQGAGDEDVLLEDYAADIKGTFVNLAVNFTMRGE